MWAIIEFEAFILLNSWIELRTEVVRNIDSNSSLEMENNFRLYQCSESFGMLDTHAREKLEKQ
jgi:hypothetical protein